MYEKLVYFRDEADHVRQLLMQEPRGRPAQCMNMILAPCDPRADVGFLTLESDEYPPMSGANTVATATVLLETAMVEMKEPTTVIKLEAPAGLVTVTADCENGKCKAVAFDNVPAFVYELDYKVEVPGIGTVSVDIAWGGMHYVLVDAASVSLTITHEYGYGPELIKVGEKIKLAVQKAYKPVHPDNPDIQGVTILEFTELLKDGPDGSKIARNTVVVSPGRLDRSPCGTGTSARMAVLYARGWLKVGQIFRHKSIIDTEFVCEILSETNVGSFKAILPRVKGRAWLTGFRQAMLDPLTRFLVVFALETTGMFQRQAQIRMHQICTAQIAERINVFSVYSKSRPEHNALARIKASMLFMGNSKPV
ncbi:proline racemase [Pyrenochaeta sp. MPI-SDFR-AT-0127]|nr:proline racemase [Pyrenochaeta sp. MPI-SDFR-AT-0127]